jgi:ADP-ribose pyrophosphatase YjhB (NUDIX family)
MGQYHNANPARCNRGIFALRNMAAMQHLIMPPTKFVLPHLLENFETRVPDGDSIERLVCRDCGHIHYNNPKIVVGAVVTHEGRFLLCKRAIEPRHGYWTIPAGYLEEHETTEAGAKREAIEEACAEIIIDALLAVYNIPRLSQVQMIYRAELARPSFSPGVESLETRLFSFEEIPWAEVAFPTVRWAIDHYRAVSGRTEFAPFSNPAM